MKKFFEKPKTFPDYLDLVIRILLLALVAAYYVLLIFGKFIFKPENAFYRSLNLFSGAGDPNIAVRIISYAFFILSASYILRLVLNQATRFMKKGRAIVNLFSSIIKYLAVIVLLFLILKAFKVDTVTLLAGAGILSLVIGLGAQPLISDVIAGLFIVFEEVFDIGDIIVVDGFRGTVKEIGVRTTQIVDAGGNVKVVNNSEIRTLVNMTSELSLAICDIDIEYGESIERVEAVVKHNLDKVKASIPDIEDGPYYKGVASLGASGVTLRFIARCQESARFQVERDMNRQMKLLFDENDINIPFTQVVVHEPTTFEKADAKTKRVAERFVEDQRELSKNIPGESKDDLQ